MTFGEVVDYSFAHPTPQAIKDAGYRGVLRYLAPLPNAKVITTAERDALLAAGLSIGLVWESTASRAGEGQGAGEADAQAANGQADHLGAPDDATIYYAVDFDAEPSVVRPYFMGAHNHGGRPVGIYGSFRVCEAILQDGTAKMAWQTVAWSHGLVSDKAVLYQRAAPTLGPVAGTDENVCLAADWGQWPRPTQPPQPTPDPVEDKVLTLIRAPNGWIGVTDGVHKRHLVDPHDVNETLFAYRAGGLVVKADAGDKPFNWPQDLVDRIADA